MPHLLPRHRHILQKLIHCVRHELQRPQVHALIVSKLSRRHVPVIFDDLSHVFRRHLLFRRFHVPKLPRRAVTLRIQRLPFTSCESIEKARAHTRQSSLAPRCRNGAMRRALRALSLALTLSRASRRRSSRVHAPFSNISSLTPTSMASSSLSARAPRVIGSPPAAGALARGRLPRARGVDDRATVARER